jgi:hypothetical protein
LPGAAPCPTSAHRGGGARRMPRCRRARPAGASTGDAAAAWRAHMRRAKAAGGERCGEDRGGAVNRLATRAPPRCSRAAAPRAWWCPEAVRARMRRHAAQQRCAGGRKLRSGSAHAGGAQRAHARALGGRPRGCMLRGRFERDALPGVAEEWSRQRIACTGHQFACTLTTRETALVRVLAAPPRAAADCVHAPGDLLRALQLLLSTICPFVQAIASDGWSRAGNALSLAGCRAHAAHARPGAAAGCSASSDRRVHAATLHVDCNRIVIAATSNTCAAACSTHALHAGRMQQCPCVLHTRADERSCSCRAAADEHRCPTCARRGGAHAARRAAAALSRPAQVLATLRRRGVHACVAPRPPTSSAAAKRRRRHSPGYLRASSLQQQRCAARLVVP